MKIRRGFLKREYVYKDKGNACIVQQPSGNYIIITHDLDVDSKIPTYYNNYEYVGDFICTRYIRTKDLDTDPNVQVANAHDCMWQPLY